MWNPLHAWLGSSPSAPRRRLLRDLLLLLAVTSGSLLAAVFFAGESLRDDLAREQLQELSRQTSADFSGFFAEDVELPDAQRRVFGHGVEAFSAG